ncbi:MAG: hypothetical protein KJ588_00255, partial [Gammaproteobacteria bacterium]|nr:hypothetical protein [Gammaproteobacteria bacterium]
SKKGGITQKYNPMLHGNLSHIIRWYKARTTYAIRKRNFHFSWQPRFYEHVIRDEKEYLQVLEYITYNPLNWKKDLYFQT